MSGAGTGIRRLEMAIALRDGGRTEEALTALQEVAERGYKRPEEEEEGEWAGAAYELALVLHALGRHAEGDVWLRRLGFRHRLADNIFSCPTAPAAAGGSGGSTWRQQKDKKRKGQATEELMGVCARAPLPLRVVDRLMPSCLLESLQAALGPSSPFWEEHRYPTSTFFSYTVPLSSGDPAKATNARKNQLGRAATSKAGSPVPPGGKLIMAVAQALLPHVEELLHSQLTDACRGSKKLKRNRKRKEMGGVELGSVEWWAHSRRGAGAGHQLHFDLDEGALPWWRGEEAKAKGQVPVPHPEVSCVVYLDGPQEEGEGHVGAPTLVLDQDVDGPQGAEPTRGWLCFPRVNRGLLFLGGLLHGVVPGRAVGDQAAHEQEAVRTTLMLGFWRKGLRPAAGPVDTSSVPSPCMRRVFSTAMSSCTNTSGKQLTKKGQPAVEAEQRMSGTCWTSLFSEAPPLRHEAKPVPVVAEVLQVSPPWVAVGPPAIDEAEDEAPRDHGLEFVGSYFLDIEPSALRDRLLYPPACHDVPARSQGGSGKLEVEFISLEELSRLRGEV